MTAKAAELTDDQVLERAAAIQTARAAEAQAEQEAAFKIGQALVASDTFTAGRTAMYEALKQIPADTDLNYAVMSMDRVSACYG